MRFETRIQGPSKRPRDLITVWLINGLGLLLVSKVVKGIDFEAQGWSELVSVLAAAAVLGLVHVALKPILIVLTLPINILSLGLFTLIINASLLYLVAWLIPTFHVSGFLSALWGSLLLSLISLLLRAIIFRDGLKVRFEK